ncbi:hypothetical protein F4804DRAFT_321017 [Jackrogersella minutella]|nr:hypothetical protein F4804DRAFT_321017 [Jackrogersella minutella]
MARDGSWSRGCFGAADTGLIHVICFSLFFFYPCITAEGMRIPVHFFDIIPGQRGSLSNGSTAFHRVLRGAMEEDGIFVCIGNHIGCGQSAGGARKWGTTPTGFTSKLDGGGVPYSLVCVKIKEHLWFPEVFYRTFDAFN